MNAERVVPTHAERVRLGAARLDARGPADWRNRLRRDRFDVRWTSTCVLGQVFRDESLDVDEDDDLLLADAGDRAYDRGTVALFGEVAEGTYVELLAKHGFEELTSLTANFDRLNRAWEDYLWPSQGATDETTETEETT